MFSKIWKILNPSVKFRDPIYGFIELTEYEKEIVDTGIFQRLRRIHQLALTKYVYPGAEHSRFVHSLGVLQAATEVFKEIYDNPNNNDSVKNLLGSEDAALEALKTLRIAALLHDIGHLPFSHATERTLLNSSKHEGIGEYIILNHIELNNIIKNKIKIKPSDVSNLILDRQFDHRSFLLKTIISGHFDSDRADYLLRDSYYCGVKYGVYDYKRYISSLKIEDPKSLKFRISYSDLPIIEEFLLARYYYTLQVPHHRSRWGYDIVLENFIRTNNEAPLIKKFKQSITEGTEGSIQNLDLVFFENFDDYSFFELIKECSQKDKEWASFLLRKNHLVSVAEKISEDEDRTKISKLITRMKEEHGLRDGIDFFHKSEKIKLHSLYQESDEYGKPSINYMVYGRSGEEIDDITQTSLMFNLFNTKKPFIWRIFTTKERAVEVSKAVRESALHVHIYKISFSLSL